MNAISNLESALDSQPAQRSDVLERSASGCSIDVPGSSHAMLRRKRVEAGLRIVKDDAGGAGSLGLTHTAVLEQGDVDARRGKNIRRCAANSPSPDNRDIGLKRPAELRIGGPPGRGKRVGPEHGPVTRFRQDRTILVHVFRIGRGARD